MRVNETATIDHLQNFDGYYEFTSKIDNKTYEIDFRNGQIKSIVDLEDKTKEFDLEKANKLFAAKTKLSNIINMSSIEPKNLEEKTGKKKPKPTNPALWARAKAAARAKFDVYPSAYANGWAAKWYKSKGGGWRMSECSGTTECDCGCSESVVGQIFDTPDAGAIAQGGVGGGISSTAGSGYDFVGYAENKDTIIKEQRLKAVIKNLVREVLSEIKDVSGTKDEAKGKKWIQKAIHPGKKGALKKALGVKAGEKIPLEKLKTAAKQGGKVGQRARLALTLRKLK